MTCDMFIKGLLRSQPNAHETERQLTEQSNLLRSLRRKEIIKSEKSSKEVLSMAKILAVSLLLKKRWKEGKLKQTDVHSKLINNSFTTNVDEELKQNNFTS